MINRRCCSGTSKEALFDRRAIWRSTPDGNSTTGVIVAAGNTTWGLGHFHRDQSEFREVVNVSGKKRKERLTTPGARWSSRISHPELSQPSWRQNPVIHSQLALSMLTKGRKVALQSSFFLRSSVVVCELFVRARDANAHWATSIMLVTLMPVVMDTLERVVSGGKINTELKRPIWRFDFVMQKSVLEAVKWSGKIVGGWNARSEFKRNPLSAHSPVMHSTLKRTTVSRPRSRVYSTARDVLARDTCPPSLYRLTGSLSGYNNLRHSDNSINDWVGQLFSFYSSLTYHNSSFSIRKITW